MCTTLVYMKNITLSADEKIIEQAREEAAKRNTSLNQLFREWLEELTHQKEKEEKIEWVFEQMKQYRAERKFNRDELNER